MSAVVEYEIKDKSVILKCPSDYNLNFSVGDYPLKACIWREDGHDIYKISSEDKNFLNMFLDSVIELNGTKTRLIDLEYEKYLEEFQKEKMQTVMPERIPVARLLPVNVESKEEYRTSIKGEAEPIKCDECHSKNIKYYPQTGEDICEDCGLVLREKGIDFGPEWRAFDAEQRNERGRVGSPPTYRIHDKGLSTAPIYPKDIYNKNIPDGKKSDFWKLRKWQRRIRISNAIERNLAFALSELDRMGSALGVPRDVRESAAVIYRKAVDKNLIRGRSIEGVAASALYAALREDNPRTLDEVALVSRVSRKEVGRTYRFISKELGLKLFPTSPIDYVPRFCSGLNFENHMVQSKANELLKQAEKKGLLSGRSPTGVAAAAVYISSILCQQRRIQKDVAEVAGVTEVTIRNRWKELAEELDLFEDFADKNNEKMLNDNKRSGIFNDPKICMDYTNKIVNDLNLSERLRSEATGVLNKIEESGWDFNRKSAKGIAAAVVMYSSELCDEPVPVWQLINSIDVSNPCIRSRYNYIVKKLGPSKPVETVKEKSEPIYSVSDLTNLDLPELKRTFNWDECAANVNKFIGELNLSEKTRNAANDVFKKIEEKNLTFDVRAAPKNVAAAVVKYSFESSGEHRTNKQLREKSGVQIPTFKGNYIKLTEKIGTPPFNFDAYVAYANKLIDDLSLGENTKNNVSDIVKKIKEKGIKLEGKSQKGIAAAVTEISARQNGIYRMRLKIANKADVSPPTVKDNYNFLLKELDIPNDSLRKPVKTIKTASERVYPINELIGYAESFSDILFCKKEVKDTAIEILKQTEEVFNKRGKPSKKALVAAALFKACFICDEYIPRDNYISLKNLASLTGASMRSIENKYKEISILLNKKSGSDKPELISSPSPT